MATEAQTQELYIRAADRTDSAALSRICLLTAAAGASAEALLTFGELPGLIWAEPYVHLPACFGFVLVDPAADGAVVGYILGAHDTRAFERAAAADWFPAVRARYPAPGAPGMTALDARYLALLHAPPRAADAALARSPAHMHIDLLPAYQRRGWGRRLVARALAHLRGAHGLARLWLGLDPQNAGARRFYARLGFVELAGAPPGTMELDFAQFRSGE